MTDEARPRNGRKKAFWIAAAVVMLLVLVAALNDPGPESGDRAEAPPSASPTPAPATDPADQARGRAAALFRQGKYDQAIRVLEDVGLRRAVTAFQARAARRMLASARRALRRGRYEAAKADAIDARGFRPGVAVRSLLASADAGIARERAEARRRREQARLARDLRSCTSSEKLIVKASAEAPPGCTEYEADLTARRAARAAEQQAELAEQAAAETSGSDCEAGYDPCVPSYPPDVNCPEVGPVTVSGSDPHGLDADGDGVACGGD